MNDIESEIYYSRDYPYYGYKYKYEEAVPSGSSYGYLNELRGRFSDFLRKQRARKVFKVFQQSSRRHAPSPSADDEMEDVMKLTDDE